MVDVIVTAGANTAPRYNLSGFTLSADNVTSLTRTVITASYGEFTITFRGDFSYDAAGTLTLTSRFNAFDFTHDGLLLISATGFDLPARDIAYGDFDTLMTAALNADDTYTSAWEGGEGIDTYGGNDTIRAGTGNDTIDGGTGYDTLIMTAGANEWSIGWDYFRGVTVTSPDGDDRITNVERIEFEDQTALITEGDDGNDRLTSSQNSVGDTVWDMINGRGGNDIIRGGGGIDFLVGEQGHDTIYGGDNRDYIYGGVGNDVLYGQTGGDKIAGQTGSDTIYGGAGNDTLVAGSEGAQSFGDVNRLYGGIGNDVFIGDADEDFLSGGKHDDTVHAGAGNDTLIGGSGKDALHGESGADNLDGGNGADRLYGGNGDDTLAGGGKSDYLSGGQGSDRIGGGSWSDTLIGGDGDDTLMGGKGRDRLFGNDGNDRLIGQEGDDKLTGRSGEDTFVFHRGYGTDIITDFTVGEDRIQIGRGADGIDDLTFTSQGNSVQITFADVTIMVENSTLAQIEDADNFLF
ncbi:calcium-binding protein [Phaeobacter inhibens]|uniref:calcium-binding protein n=1 Tax=Phaeobacter inhibens TaxID=221822 RepID=UPI000C9C66B3|nr:calcium-binding protein [Phaeobacter inhibens]AUQ66394.1 hemolysin-type calcium-binding repeat-containing protein [Phaeobacter inhibens]